MISGSLSTGLILALLANAVALAAPPPLDLAIVKDDGVTAAQPGQTLTYVLTISNVGQSNATGSRTSSRAGRRRSSAHMRRCPAAAGPRRNSWA